MRHMRRRIHANHDPCQQAHTHCHTLHQEDASTQEEARCFVSHSQKKVDFVQKKLPKKNQDSFFGGIFNTPRLLFES
jgi:hypothetical protein